MKEINRELLEKLITDLDESADVSLGGPYDTYIISPILDRLEADPLEVDFSTYARSILANRRPDLDFEEGDVLSTAVAKPMQLLTKPMLDQLMVMQRNGSLRNYQFMDSDEIDDLLANLFWQRPEGGYASGPIRIYFAQPTMLQIGTGNYCTSKSGLKFIPTLPYSITASAMATNKEGNLYYMTIYVRAEEPGEEYNIERDGMATISGVPNVVSISNLRKFEGGTENYTDAEAVDAAQRSIIERTLTSSNGIITQLIQELSGIRHVNVVGFGDPYMTRDVIKGGSAGAILDAAKDAVIIDDGDFDNQSTHIELQGTDVSTLLGGIGEVTDNYLLYLGSNDYLITEVLTSNTVAIDTELPLEESRPYLVTGVNLTTVAGSTEVGSAGANFITNYVEVGMCLEIIGGANVGKYRIVSVETETKLILNTPMQASLVDTYRILFGYAWTIRKKSLSLSEVPYGEVLTSGISDNEVHIGGMTDIYLSGTMEERGMLLESISDQEPLISGIDLERSSADEVTSPTLTFNNIEVGDQVYIKDGEAAGVYRVLAISGNDLQLDSTVPLFTGARFHITRLLDIELTDPLESKYSGTDLVTSLGTDIATTSSAVGFTSYGVQVGDYLRILQGDDEGDYVITAISGTGGEVLEVNHKWTRSYWGINFEVVAKQTAIQLPVIDVKSVELLDINSEPTGEFIPYAKPVSIEALGPFTNVGEGELGSYTVDIGMRTGNLMAGASVDGDSHDFVVNGVTVTVTYAGFVDPYTAEEIASCINDAIPDSAEVRDVAAGDRRVYIQSSTRLIDAVGDSTVGSVNDKLGLAYPNTEHSDQIRETSGLNWIEEGVTTRSVVQINGDSNYYAVYSISGTNNEYIRARRLFKDGRFYLAQDDVSITIGERSLGLARAYFKDPTYFAVMGPHVLSELELMNANELPWLRDVTKLETYIDNAKVAYCPDSEKQGNLIPSSSDQPNNGEITTPDKFKCDPTVGIDSRSSALNFLAWGVQGGDILEITKRPIVGTVDLSGGPLSLDGETLEFTLDGFAHQITFTANDTALRAVRDRIDQQCGLSLTKVYNNAGMQYLVLETDLDLVVTSEPGAPNKLFDLSLPYTNEHPDAGNYIIQEVDTNLLTVRNMDGTSTNFTIPTPVDENSIHFKIKRPGLQVFNPADMELEDSLYYVDIEVMSEGFGNFWNIPQNQLFTLSDYTSYGWYVSTENEATSYSEYEKLWMHITSYFLPQDEVYDPDNMFELSGQNIQITYGRSDLVGEAQAYVERADIRNANQNALVRHLLPSFIYLNLEYSGGASEDSLVQSLESLIRSVRPGSDLSVYSISNIVSKRLAHMLTNPINIVGLTWESDRSVQVYRSDNKLEMPTRYVLYPGIIVAQRS